MSERAFVIGDTHLGEGDDELEDFRQDAEFAEFLQRIADPQTTLFLNGDFVDFPQIAPFDTPGPNHLLWTEEASLTKLDAAIQAHPGCFAALKDFMARGGRLVVLIGNHDLDLAWRRVQDRFRVEVGGVGADVLRFTVGSEMFHGVHVEHGHEFSSENCPHDPRAFFHEYQGRMYLERVWGTDFMLQFYNDLERTHPYADNVKPMLSILWHGLKNHWIGGRELVRVLFFLKKRGVPWEAIGSSVLAAPDNVGPDMIANVVTSSFADDEWRQMLRERAQEPAFRDALADSIAQLAPVERQLVVEAEACSMGITPVLVPEADGTRTLGIFRDDREIRAAKDRLGRPGVTAVVFGHTHSVVDGENLENGMKRRLYNPGTWLPKLDLRSEHVRQKIQKQGLTKEMLADQTLFSAERSAVQIEESLGYASQVKLVSCP